MKTKLQHSRRIAAQTRAHVLEVASELFYWDGIRVTGVDRIASAAEVAPSTLYRLFASKDDLVSAYIARSDALYREWFREAAARGGDDPGRRIVTVFEALGEQVQPERCRGCPFLMALAEFPDPELASHRNAVVMKAWVRDQLRQMCAELAPASTGFDAAALADDLVLVLEGAYASAQALGAGGPAGRAAALAAALIEAAMGGAA